MKSILDRSFRYTPSVETDLRKTFAKIRRRQREAEAAPAQTDHEANNVLPIDMKKMASQFPKSI
jgi:hypothetical protein